jgi:hypothetical protein
MFFMGHSAKMGNLSLGGGPMRRVYNLFFELPETCSRMSFHELLMTAALVTLVVSVILMISGRKLA